MDGRGEGGCIPCASTVCRAHCCTLLPTLAPTFRVARRGSTRATRYRLQAALTGTRDGMDLCGRAVPECLGARDDGDGPSTRLRRHGRGGSDESAWACRPVTTDHVRGRLQRVLSLGGRCVMCMHGQYRHRALCADVTCVRHRALCRGIHKVL